MTSALKPQQNVSSLKETEAAAILKEKDDEMDTALEG